MHISDARKELKALANTFKAIKEIDGILELTDEAETRFREAEKKLQGLYVKISDAELKLASEEGKVHEASFQADNIIDQAGKKAHQIEEAAKKEASALLEAAEKKNAALKSAIQVEQYKLEKAQADAAVALAEKEKIDAALEASKAKLKDLLG